MSGNAPSGSLNANYSKSKQYSSATQKPILSDQWTGSFDRATGNMNAGGYTPDQATGSDWIRNNLNTNPVGTQRGVTNQYINDVQGAIGDINMNGLNQFATGAARQADYAGDVTAKTGAGFMDAYKNPYQTDVIDASIADYNAGADRALSGMRAGRDAAGAFGDRAAIQDAVFNADANRGLGSLVSGLRSQGFTTAAGLGMQDSNRDLTAGMSNQSARAQNNQFNVNAGYQGDQQRIGAYNDIVRNGLSAAGLSQQQFNNIVNENGVNTDAAKALFNAGSISQSQLNQILQLSGEANGNQIDSRGGSSSKSKGGSVGT